jgi:DNA polymerase-3 subunit beta
VQITTAADFGSGSENMSTTVAARKFLDILRALPEAGEVAIAVAGKKLTIQSGKSKFSLQTLAAEEFPTVAQPAAWNASLSLPQKTLKHLFNMVHFAMAQQDIRYYLNGMLLVVEGKSVRAVATDGHRLAYCAVETDAENAKQEVIIPRKTILEMQRLLADNDDPVRIDVASNMVRFTFADIELVSKLVEGKFPDYQRVIPSGYTRNFLIGREQLQQSLSRAAILTSDKFKGVRMLMGHHAIKINSTNADQEEAQEELEIDSDFEPLDIGFNVSYLLDVLSNLKTDQVQWWLGDANSSALITMPERQDFKYVVMPMRI